MKGIKIPYIPVCLSQLPREFRGGGMMTQRRRIGLLLSVFLLLMSLLMTSLAPPLWQDPIRALSVPSVLRESRSKPIPWHEVLAQSINYAGQPQCTLRASEGTSK